MSAKSEAEREEELKTHSAVDVLLSVAAAVSSFVPPSLLLLATTTMGRKSSAKDRAYITQSERKDGYGSIRSGGGAGNQNSSAVARRAALVSLPFTHCRLTCERWIDPVCSPDGDVFDVTAAVPAIRASGGRNPLTGEALALKDLVRLHYHRVGDPSASASASSSSSLPPFGCPVTGKEFTPSSHIVAIRTTGNVFSFDAVERLNLKAKNLRDLLDDTPFTKSDVIHLQDPADVSGTAAARAEKMSRAAEVGLGSIGASKKAAAAGAAAAADAPPSPSLDPNGGSSNLDASALGKDAQRILARIQASSSSMGPGGPAAGGRGDRGASRLPGSDPRLRAPERERVAAPAFKAGAATWDTSGDDSSQQQLTLQMRKAAEKRRRREEAEEEARKVKEANGIAKRGEEKKAPAPYGEKVFERLALAAKAAAAASARPVAFTSSVTPLVSAPPSKNAALDLIPKPPRFRRARVEKGYCRLSTSLGDLNLELFADAAPRAVENFVVLAQAGYYDGCVFHRSVRNFMAQSGVRFSFFLFFFFLRRRKKVQEKKNFFLTFLFPTSLTQQPKNINAGPNGYGPRRRVHLRRPLPLRGPRGKEPWLQWRRKQRRKQQQQPSFSFHLLPLPRRPRRPRHGQPRRPRRQRLAVLHIV